VGCAATSTCPIVADASSTTDDPSVTAKSCEADYYLHCVDSDFLLTKRSIEWTRFVSSPDSNGSISENFIEFFHVLRSSDTQESEHGLVIFEREGCLVA
jgi:hypothetical protein